MTDRLDTISDESLMLRFASGDSAAFSELYQRHRQGLYAFLSRQTGKVSWLDDLYQDVWMAVTKARFSYKPEAMFKTWLYQIAYHRMIDYLRQHLPSGHYTSLDADTEGMAIAEQLAEDDHTSPDQQLTQKQISGQLLKAIDNLPMDQREAFLLREHGEMSIEQIAKITGVLPETAKSRLRYAVAKLKQVMISSVRSKEEDRCL